MYIPCLSAADALIARNIYPPTLFEAMLTATRFDKVKVFQGGNMFAIPLEAWRMAAAAAGGFREVAPRLAQAKAESTTKFSAQYVSLVLDHLQGILFW